MIQSTITPVLNISIPGDSPNVAGYSATAAHNAGAESVLLAEQLAKGGTTPSLESIKAARTGIPYGTGLDVMIRPDKDGFVYSDNDIADMTTAIELAGKNGATGVVFGALNTDGSIHVAQNAALVRAAKDAGLTPIFHRAIDATPNHEQAIQQLLDLEIIRVITTGGKYGSTATAVDGVQVIAQLVRAANERCKIMAAGGIDAASIPTLFKGLRDQGIDPRQIGLHAYKGATDGGFITERAIHNLRMSALSEKALGLPTFNPQANARLSISPAQQRQWVQDGFMVLDNFLTPEQVALVTNFIDTDPTVIQHLGGASTARGDGKGSKVDMLIWNTAQADSLGRPFLRSSAVDIAKWCIAASSGIKFDKVNPYPVHTKIVDRNQAHGAIGAVVVHQDAGFWKKPDYGIYNPDALVTFGLAATDATIANGCLQVIKGSHKLPLFEHTRVGGQLRTPTQFVDDAIRELNQGWEHVELKAGQVVVFHPRLLHRSEATSSTFPRRAMLYVVYNDASNSPLVENPRHPNLGPLQVLPDNCLDDRKIIPLSPDLPFVLARKAT